MVMQQCLSVFGEYHDLQQGDEIGAVVHHLFQKVTHVALSQVTHEVVEYLLGQIVSLLALLGFGVVCRVSFHVSSSVTELRRGIGFVFSVDSILPNL